jgi:hypothetical protein
MFSNGNLVKPITSGLLLLGAVISSSAHSQEAVAEPDYSYVVNVQDYNGQDLCNGVYLGGNVVMLHSGCETNSFPFPIPIEPGQPPIDITPGDGTPIDLDGTPIQVNQATVNGVTLSAKEIAAAYASEGFVSNTSASLMLIDPGAPDFDYSDDEYGFSIIGPGQPSQVIFTDRNGVQHPAVRIKRRMANPYNNARDLVAVETVPDDVSNIALASLDQIEAMETQDEYPLTLVTRGIDGKVTTESRHLANYEECNSFPFPLPIDQDAQDPLNRNVCIKGAPIFCGIGLPGGSSPAIEPELGAPFIGQLASGESVVVAQRTASCDRYPAASNHQHWANTTHFKTLGLQTAVAYDLGERDVLERPYLNVLINNESADQKFDVFNAALFKDDGFDIVSNSCGTLEPGDSCVIKLRADVSDAVSMKNLLTLEVNGENAGIYTKVDGVAHRFVKGDQGALWKMKGWKVAGFGLFGKSIYTNAEITRSPSITRTRYEVNPESVTITYKLEGQSTFGAALFTARQQMGATGMTGFLNSGLYTLPGTDGEWVTKTFDLPEPGAYSISVTRFIYPVNEADEFDMSIKEICFGNECSQL